MNKKQLEPLLYSTAGLVVMFVILVAVNVIAGFVKTRVDLTADKAYTLSAGTKAILNKLDTPVVVRFYCTQSDTAMPVVLKAYAQRVEDLLAEYRQYAHGELEIKKFDPKPDSDAEDSANLDGVEGQMANTGDKIYLGLAVSCLDEKVPIPFLSPDREKLLEYDLSRAISRVVTPQKPVVGVMSSLPVFGEMNPMMMRMGQPRQEPWVFISELKRDYDVKQVEINSERIDDDIKVLVVIHPKEMAETTQYAIDQFVLRGGKLMVFVDPLSIVDSRNNPSNPLQGSMNSGSTVDKLFKAWGVGYDVNKVVADQNYLSRINRGTRAEAAPAVLSLTREAVDPNDSVTAQIDNLLLPFSGVFTGTPAEGLKETVLLKTSKDSQLVEKFVAEFSGEQVMKDFVASGKEYPLAIRLTGKFKTAFPDGQPKAKEADAAEKKDKPAAAGPTLKESKPDGVVILVGDTDLLYDQFSVQVQDVFGQRIVIPRNGNLNLVQNMIDQLAGDSNLIAVRSRATINRPFTVVKKMQAQAEDRYRSKIKELEQSLSDAQARLNDLQKTKETGQRFILSPEQQAEIQKFQQKEAGVKKELKTVRRDLRQDIDSLENRLKWLNIAGMPLLVTISGVALALYKRKRTAAK
ncbi:MAG: GldG family protein [Limisphaerales bacterium]